LCIEDEEDRWDVGAGVSVMSVDRKVEVAIEASVDVVKGLALLPLTALLENISDVTEDADSEEAEVLGKDMAVDEASIAEVETEEGILVAGLIERLAVEATNIGVK
jgi:hypothetical protein